MENTLTTEEGRGQGNLGVIERMTFDQQVSFEARSWRDPTTRSARWRTRLPDRVDDDPSTAT